MLAVAAALVLACGCDGKRAAAPQADKQDDELPPALIVSISATNEITVRGKQVTELDALFAQAYADDPKTVVVIATADGVPSAAAAVVEKARAANLKLAVAVDEDRVRRVTAEAREGVRLALPGSRSNEIDPGTKSLVVTVTVAGEILVQGTVVKADDLDDLFAAAYVKDPQTQVIIEAEQGVKHGIVVHIMEQAKQAGLSKLAIATKGGEKP